MDKSQRAWLNATGANFVREFEARAAEEQAVPSKITAIVVREGWDVFKSIAVGVLTEYINSKVKSQ